MHVNSGDEFVQANMTPRKMGKSRRDVQGGLLDQDSENQWQQIIQ